MSTENPADEQRRLEEFGADRQCQAIAVLTSRRCQRIAVADLPYCPEHFDLLEQM